ncbi:unnamed protein product [Amoebophrya sp. A25]|nr:unnamed protein product [Amoebophrya sp. A25]|eukprot:GSA25T00001837001.1
MAASATSGSKMPSTRSTSSKPMVPPCVGSDPLAACLSDAEEYHDIDNGLQVSENTRKCADIRNCCCSKPKAARSCAFGYFGHFVFNRYRILDGRSCLIVVRTLRGVSQRRMSVMLLYKSGSCEWMRKACNILQLSGIGARQVRKSTGVEAMLQIFREEAQRNMTEIAATVTGDYSLSIETTALRSG